MHMWVPMLRTIARGHVQTCSHAQQAKAHSQVCTHTHASARSRSKHGCIWPYSYMRLPHAYMYYGLYMHMYPDLGPSTLTLSYPCLGPPHPRHSTMGSLPAPGL